MSKEIDLLRKTITEDKDGNASISGKAIASVQPTDNNDLTTKLYVDNAIAQASIGGEVDTSGFALKTELPTKTSQLTNDSGFITSIPDEYVTSSEVQQMSEGFKAELDKKSDILNYSDHSLNGTETYNNLEKVIGEGSEAIYIINKPINLIEGTTCSVEVKFSDNTNLLLQGKVISIVLHEKQVNCIQITGQGTAGLMVIDKARYTIKDGSGAPEHDDNVSSLMVLHPNANNVISLIITKPTTFEINNSFFTNYQFVNDTEKENWNNKADKSELFSGDYNDLTNKPCYDTRITERKTYTYTYSVSNTPGIEIIKVSDDTYTIEEIKNFSNVTITFDYMDDTVSETYNCPMLSESDYSLVCFPDQLGNIGAAYICNGIVCIVLKDTENASAGTYFMVQADSDCIIEFSFDYLLSGEIKALDEKYLANKPGRIVYVPNPDGSGSMLMGEVFNSCLNRAGAFSHAEGANTNAMGMSAHSEGFYTEANGTYSHAEGFGTIANGNSQHAQGRYNAPLGDSYAHIVGNGSSKSNRKNAHTLDWNGNAWFQGDVFVKGTSQDDAEKLATEEFVNDAIDNMSEGFSGDYNDLENKPVYDTRTIENVVLEIDKDMDLSNYETKDILIFPDESYYFKLVKLRPVYPGDIDNMKESGTLTKGEETVPIKQAIEIDPEEEGVGIIFEFLIIVERDEFNYFPGGPIESGIWMLHSSYIIDENGEHVEQASGVELHDGMIIRYDSLSSGELRQLDKKFIPDSIATKEYVNDQIAENKFSGDYNDLENKPTIPSIEGLTTKLYVDQSISQVNEDLQNQINELFQNVSSGKELIASAITDKGVDASEEETFQSLSEKINQIPVGPPGSNIIGYINENNDIYVSLTELESGTYTLKFEDYTGLLNEFDDIGTVEV